MILSSCGSGGGGTTPLTAGGTAANPVYGQYNSPGINISSFLDVLEQVDGERSGVTITPNWNMHGYYVIWDNKKNVYKAISVNYLRSIVYYDYYSNDTAVASEFRRLESVAFNPNGEFNSDGQVNYEIVDTSWAYNWSEEKWEDNYYGRISGTMYEDDMQTTDVSLMARESENDKFIKKAAKVSMMLHLSIETSLSMVTLGAKIEKMLARNNGELTENDQAALMADMQTLTGVKLSEMSAALEDKTKKEEVLAKIANKLGTSVQNLELKLLPDVFGITL